MKHRKRMKAIPDAPGQSEAYGRGQQPPFKKGKERMDDLDRRRKRGLIAFQIFVYGMLIAMFAIQLQMYLTRHW